MVRKRRNSDSVPSITEYKCNHDNYELSSWCWDISAESTQFKEEY